MFMLMIAALAAATGPAYPPVVIGTDPVPIAQAKAQVESETSPCRIAVRLEVEKEGKGQKWFENYLSGIPVDDRQFVGHICDIYFAGMSEADLERKQ